MHVHVIHTTHWDREWVQSAAQYRVRLVELVDGVLDAVPGDRGVFTLDGQTVAIEDYLAVRPERRAEVAAAVASGRLAIGPWYVLADQFLEGDEAAVRNLLIGTGIAAGLGGTMRHGYVPDSFGSIAALPMILRGFAIPSANCGRGVRDNAGSRLFTWAAPDGSSVLAWDLGYANAIGLAYPDIWRNLDWAPATPASAAAAAQRLLAAEKDRWPVALRYASAGIDHLPPQPGFAAILAGLDQGAAWTASTPAGFASAAAEAVAMAGVALPVVHGELRGSPGAGMDLQGVLSTDPRLKRINRRLERLLVELVEPLDAALPAAGAGTRRAILRQLWRELVQSHAHDSICACNTDPVMVDIHARMRAVEEAATLAVGRWLRAAVPTRPRREGDRALVRVRGGLGGAGARGWDLLVRLPGDCPERMTVLESGRPCGSATVVARRRMDLETCHAADADLVAVRSKDPKPGHDPAQVFAMVRLTAVTRAADAEFELTPAGCTAPALEAGDRHLDNGILRIEVAADGTFSLTDRRSGRTWRGLGGFEDAADAGDTYDAVPVQGDRPLASRLGAAASSRLVAADAWSAELETVLRWRIPVRLAEGARRDRRLPSGWWRIAAVSGSRSPELVELVLTSRLRLWAGVPRLEIRTAFENHADHHRLRLALPVASGAPVTGGTQFGAIARPWTAAEDPLPCRPLLDWVQADGLAVLVGGIYEMEARGDDATVLLTLCRSTDTIGPAAGMNLDVESARACGAHEAVWALEPAADPVAAAAAARIWLEPCAAVGAFAASGDAPFAALGPAPASATPGVEVTACKRADDGKGAVLRLLNRRSSPVEAEVVPGFRMDGVRPVELDESAPACRACRTDADGRLRITVPAQGLATVRQA